MSFNFQGYSNSIIEYPTRYFDEGPINEHEHSVGYIMIRDPKAKDIECGSCWIQRIFMLETN